jgi:hypothetical protein
MRERRLVWVALGAGLAAFAFLIAQFLTLDKQDERFLTISGSNSDRNVGEAIAAVGHCVGRFKLLSTNHVTKIKLPLNSLHSGDFICLIDKLGGVSHDMSIERQEWF